MSRQLRADILLLVITVIWGASFTLMKNVLDHIPSFAYLAIRFGIAAITMVLIFHQKLRYINKKTLIHGFVIGLMLFGGMALQVTGLYYTTASNSAFITGMNVVMVPIISAIMLRKRPDKASTYGVILAFVGLYLLSVTKDFSFCLNFGDFLTFLCAICFTLQIIFIDKFTVDEDPALLAVLQIGFAAVLYIIVWLIIDFGKISTQFAAMSSDWSTVVSTLLVTGVLGTAFAFAIQTIAQKDTSPTHTALILTAEPVFGAIFALLIPNSLGVTEVLKINTMLGCVLILTGMIISEIKIGKSEEPNDNIIDGTV